MTTHTQFTVRLADHEAGDPNLTARRVRHAAETFEVVYAYFKFDAERRPIQAADGTFEVHAPSWTTLDTLRQMFDHEGLTVVREDEVPGNGIVVAVERDQ